MKYEEMMKTKTEEEIMEYMDSLSEKEVLEFLEVEPVKIPTKEEIMSKTKSGWMGMLVMDYIEETYPRLFPCMLLSGKLMKIVEERTTEAKEQMGIIEERYYQEHRESDPNDTMERIQKLMEAREVANEQVKEILTRPL